MPTEKNLEIELKLVGDPAVLESAWATPGLKKLRAKPTPAKKLSSTYYDTSDFDLRKHGIGLRVRADGDGFTQTLKTAAQQSNGIRRQEWNVSLAEPDVDLSAFKRTRALAGVDGLDRLGPVFETIFTRQTAMLKSPREDASARVELALDRGEIKAERAAIPIAEIELELKEGDPAAIFDLALALSEEAPLRVETRSKWSRGWDLIAGTRPAWRKAEPISLDKKMTLDGAVAAILGGCYGHWLANQAAAIDGGDPEGVHQLRVALRRLRTSLSIFRKSLDLDSIAWIRTEARWVLQSLGDARDLDVFLQELIVPVVVARPGDPGLKALRQAAEATRDRAYESAREVLTSPRYTRFLLRFGAWLERHEWRENGRRALDKPVADFAGRWLNKTHRRTIAAGADFGRLTPEARHEIRLMLKKVRYASEFFQSLHRKKRTRAYIKRLRALQDDLGHINDLSSVEVLVGRVLRDNKRRGPIAGQMRYAGGMLVGWYANYAKTALEHAVLDWDKFVAAKPYWE